MKNITCSLEQEQTMHCNEVQERKDCENPPEDKEIDNVEINMEYEYHITIAGQTERNRMYERKNSTKITEKRSDD